MTSLILKTQTLSPNILNHKHYLWDILARCWSDVDKVYWSASGISPVLARAATARSDGGVPAQGGCVSECGARLSRAQTPGWLPDTGGTNKQDSAVLRSRGSAGRRGLENHKRSSGHWCGHGGIKCKSLLVLPLQNFTPWINSGCWCMCERWHGL